MHKLLIAVLVSLAPVAAQIPPSAAIRGAVTDDKGRALSGVLVTAVLNAGPPLARTSTSAADGSFQIQGLPAGPYSLCAQLPAGGYLDPCQWSLNPTSLTLIAKQVSTGNAVTLRKGSIVKIRMQDPGRLLAQKTRDGRQPHLLIAVPALRGLNAAQQTGKDSNGADYEVTVPNDSSLTIQVVSRDLKLGDKLGNPLANNSAREAFQHGSADPNPKTFSYTVLSQLP